MDLLRTLLYTLGRIGLLIMLVLFGAFMGEILFPAATSFLPSSMIGLKEFMINDTVQSAVALIVVCLFFIWVFYDDGKRHSAYEDWSVVNILIVLMVMLVIYFIPAIFRDSFTSEGRADVFYMIFYYPCTCFMTEEKDNFLIGILISTLIMIACAFSSYTAAFVRYMKKHPSLRVKYERAAEQDDDDADSAENAENPEND